MCTDASREGRRDGDYGKLKVRALGGGRFMPDTASLPLAYYLLKSLLKGVAAILMMGLLPLVAQSIQCCSEIFDLLAKSVCSSLKRM